MGGDPQGRAGRRDPAQGRRLEQLKVAVVAAGQPHRQGERLLEGGLDDVGVAADQLHHVRVLLLRHDRRAGGEGVREAEPVEARVHIEDHVGGEARAGLGGLGQGEEGGRLGLAAAGLDRGHRLHRPGEGEEAGGQASVDRGEALRDAVAGSRPERTGVGLGEGGLEERRVVDQEAGVAERPEAEGRGHRRLEVGHPRQRRVADLCGEVGERLGGVEGLAERREQVVAEPEGDVGGDLIVARAGGVDPPRRLAGDPLAEDPLDRRVDVLVGGAGRQLAASRLGVEPAQLRLERVCVVTRQQPRGPQGLDVGEGAEHVVGGDVAVDPSIVADGIGRDLGVEGRALVPEGLHPPRLRGGRSGVLLRACGRASGRVRGLDGSVHSGATRGRRGRCRGRGRRRGAPRRSRPTRWRCASERRSRGRS